MSNYIPTIGLEVHAELKTRTKMFCTSRNDPDEARPNVNVCPVCMAHPGTLPVINKEAVRHILRLGSAVGGTLAEESVFDRKSYFYPDIPKGYQISQYQHPLVLGGDLAGVALTRIHLEEDTARSIHIAAKTAEGGSPDDKSSRGKSLIDFNRAGIPLMELVTEPVIRDAETAGRFARELQLLLRTLGAGEANLEKGEMRIEANISVSKQETENGEQKLGTKVEVKNLNSFRSVERAIAYEAERQAELIASGGEVVQETRGWDEAKQVTFHQRFKEGSADYRYFPEPDLPKLYVSEVPELAPDAIRASLPELPWDRRARYARDFALKEADIAFIVATTERSAFFDAAARALMNDAKQVLLASNYLTTDVAGIFAKESDEDFSKLDPGAFAELIRMTSTGALSSRGAKDLLVIVMNEGGEPKAIAQERGLLQAQDAGALEAAVDAVIAAEAKVAEEYRGGKESALQYLIGKAMKESKGAGNPAILRELLIEKLKH